MGNSTLWAYPISIRGMTFLKFSLGMGSAIRVVGLGIDYARKKVSEKNKTSSPMLP